MNQPQYIRQPIPAPPHIVYAHKLGRGLLTFGQIEQLVMAINPAYVQSANGKSYLAQHQARAEMNRIFGYGNWDSQVDEMTLMYEEQRETGSGNAKKMRWVVGYRAKVTVNIRDLWGMPVATFSEHHAEENAPQPNRGEAHALALTSVESYALRRALIGLGDRFGLGLYNGGSMAPHGQYTIQLEAGQLFQWTEAAAQQQQPAAAPTQVTHTTIQAQTIADDNTIPEQQQQQQQQPAAPAPQQAPQQTARMQEFSQTQQQMQQDREAWKESSMAQRMQQGMKVDGVQQ